MKNRVRFLRRERHWSQQELAARVGVSSHCINAIEQERFLPSVKLAYDIAAVLDRSVLDVFPPQSPSAMAASPMHDSRLRSLSLPVEPSAFYPLGPK
jgi:putative transcriptional regulator